MRLGGGVSSRRRPSKFLLQGPTEFALEVAHVVQLQRRYLSLVGERKAQDRFFLCNLLHCVEMSNKTSDIK